MFVDLTDSAKKIISENPFVPWFTDQVNLEV